MTSLYVATEHDSVYAIDADDGTIYWQVGLIAAGGRTVNGDTDFTGPCGNIAPEIGITGTPVIDPATGTLYVVARSYVAGAGVQYLHALDVGTGAEKFAGPVQIRASVPGIKDGMQTTVTFDGLQENNRAALLLDEGHVVIAWTSNCDIYPWHGWVLAYSAQTLAQEAAFNTSPRGWEGGVWMSGGGPAADALGGIYFATGNGSWNGSTDFGDSIVKLAMPAGGSMPVAGYFTPYDQATLSGKDLDVSAGGLVLLPPTSSGRELLAQMGKQGTIYLLDRNTLGGYCVKQSPACVAGDTQIVQEIEGASGGVWGSPAYWNGSVYWGPSNDTILQYSFDAGGSGLLSVEPSSRSANVFAYPPPTPSISADGTTDGILWALGTEAPGATGGCAATQRCQVLYAYDATDLGTLLYSSDQAPNGRDVLGVAPNFATPTIANGKVYVGSAYAVAAFGQLQALPTAAAPVFSPAAGIYAQAQTVTLADATAGARIHYTIDGTTPSAASPLYTAPLAIEATTTVQAIAAADGYAWSAVSGASYSIAQQPQEIQVDLSAANVYAIADAGSPVMHGGIDYAGNAYAQTLLGGSISWSGSTFALGAAGAADGVRATAIALPAGNFAHLSLLAAAVNANAPGRVFTVNYTDGTNTKITQSLSNWVKPQAFPGESTAAAMAYRIKSNGSAQRTPNYLYGYSWPIDSGKTVESLVLPTNWNIVVMAVDLVP